MYKVKLGWQQSTQNWAPPVSVAEFYHQFGPKAVTGENTGYPYPIKTPGFGILEQNKWRMYAILRMKGLPAWKAYKTVKHNSPTAVFLAMLLEEKHGYDKAMLMLLGINEVPYGIDRIIEVLELPKEFFPARQTGFGISASASRRLLRQVKKCLPYVEPPVYPYPARAI